MNQVLPVPYFADPSTNEPVSNGAVYIGEPDLDPFILANRITVTLIEQDGTEVEILPAAQPLTLGPGGVLMYNGSAIAMATVETNYSIAVYNSDDELVNYVPDQGIPDLITNLQNSTYTLLGSVAGTNTITATTTPVLSAYAVGARFAFRPVNPNSGAVTLNISGLGAGAVTHNGAPLATGDLATGIPAEVMVTSAVPTFSLMATGTGITPGSLPASPIEAGTVMVFIQNTVPTDWTFIVDNDAHVIMNTNDSSEGGDTGGTWTIDGITIGDTTLTAAQSGVPAHVHAIFKAGDSGNDTLGSGQTPATVGSFGANNEYKIGNFSTDAANAGAVDENATAAAASPHTHTFASDGTWRPAFVKCITAEYDP